jgi:fucose permease
MTSVLGWGSSWRWGYAVIGLLLCAVTACFAATRHRWDADRGDRAAAAGAASRVGIAAALRHPPAWMGIVLFFVYTGLEVTAGQWAFTLLTESRGVAITTAGGAVGAYWGSLTLGRLAFGALARRRAPLALLRIGTGLAPAAAALVSLRAGTAADVAGLALLGFALAPIFPLLISLTPQRVADGYADHAVGFQVAAAYLGAAALPGAAGAMAHAAGLEVLGPFMLAAAVALLLLHEIGLRSFPIRDRVV